MPDLKRKSVRGGAVTMLSQGISIAIQLASTVTLARLLSPNDYGVMAMVMAVTGFAGLFRDLGLSSASIQKKDLTTAQQSNLFWINVGMGTLLTAMVASASPLVAWFYGKPELTAVTLALSSTFLIGSFGTQSGAMLVRIMQFGRQAAAGIAGALVGFAVSVTLAYKGLSYWSLVWGNLCGALVTTALLIKLSPFRPGMMSKGTGIREMLKFGANITAFDFVNYFHRNLDNLLIGRFIGSEALGIYSRAYSLLMLPLNTIRGPINAVGFPALSRLQNNPEQFRNYSRSITSIIAFFSMPLVAFLGVSAGWIIPLVLGPGWDQSIEVFSILAIAAFLQPVSSMRGQVMLSMGRGDRYLRWGVANAIITSISFLVGINWGLNGLAMAYAIANTVIFYPSIRYAFYGTPIRQSDFFVPLLRPAFASISGVVVLLLWNASVDAGALGQVSVRIFTDLPIFGFIYLGLTGVWASGRRDMKAAVNILRRK
ncbi:lipopolysaccharide biosynthesis protein [Akkermansiaceae bacterium]|nr:lipopolysaccharide biosynthesis protein [Akkermansiaceae bacterium]